MHRTTYVLNTLQLYYSIVCVLFLYKSTALYLSILVSLDIRQYHHNQPHDLRTQPRDLRTRGLHTQPRGLRTLYLYGWTHLYTEPSLDQVPGGIPGGRGGILVAPSVQGHPIYKTGLLQSNQILKYRDILYIKPVYYRAIRYWSTETSWTYKPVYYRAIRYWSTETSWTYKPVY